MPRMKKLASILLALVMVMAVATASAATVDNQTEHNYDAYQIFAGTQSATGAALGDVVWGEGVNGAALLETLKKDYDYFEACTSAAGVADVLAKTADKSAQAMAFANAAAKHLTTKTATIKAGETSVELPAGYYLLVDTTDVSNTNDARNTALLQVTNDGNITIEKKYSVPSVDKAIVENNTDVEAVDRNIGDVVDFKLTGTLPSNYADYDIYKYEFQDTLSAGLALNATYDEADTTKVLTGVTVKIDGTDVTSNFTITYSGTNLVVSCTNLKEIANVTANATVIVTYSATLNNNAVVGSAGNPNTVVLAYSNDPNHSGEGTPSTGKTPEDKVLVFTYKLDVDKIDGSTAEDENPIKLANAEFILLNSNQDKVAKISEGKIVAWIADNTIAKNTDGTYPSDYTLKSDPNGEFALAGLDAGTYYLKETKAPAGYNLLTSPIKVVISATLDTSENNPALTSLNISVNDSEAKPGDLTTGVVEATVINNSGATLPETGGMGTTILYVAGGLLIAAALIVLVAKRRTAA